MRLTAADICELATAWWSKPTMVNPNLVPIVFASLAILTISLFTFVININSKNGRSPPGPRSLPIVGHLPLLDRELHTYFTHLGRTYGPILQVNLGKKVGIVISSPSLAKEILKDYDTTFATHPITIAAKVATYEGSGIVWSPYGPEWRMLRKACVHGFLGNTILAGTHALRHQEVRRTVRDIYNRGGSPVNIGELIFETVLNVMTNMLWGDTVKGNERDCIGFEFREVVARITSLYGKPNVSDYFPGLARFDLQGVEKEMKALSSRLDGLFQSMIDQRLKMKVVDAGEESKDFLQYLLKLMNENESKTPLTGSHLKALLMDLVVGGTDTTSNTVEYAMAEIMNNPEILKKVQQEIDMVVGTNNIVEESHTQQLHYLQAVIKEVLRLHPALPLLVPHCPSETCTIGGYEVSKGAHVFINVWAIHRDPSIWENPLEFDPNRFVNGIWEFSGNDFSYLPFGSGRRICAGIAVAEKMMMFMIASLIHSFEWKIPQGEELDFAEKFGIVLKKKVPLVAIPTQRLLGSALYN